MTLNKTLIFLAFLTFSFACQAQNYKPNEITVDDFFTEPNPKLSSNEREALRIVKEWERGGKSVTRHFVGSGGTIKYIYGQQKPSVICAVLQVCDIVLEAGESVNSLHVGDSSRWLVEPAMSKTGDSSTQHIIVKPLEVGLDTTMIVTTDRRAYYIRLRSHRTDYMHRVEFIYPSKPFNKLARHRQQRQMFKQKHSLNDGTYLGDLNFDYRLSGRASWKPSRVYDDGKKTIIEMPSSMEQTEAPILLIVEKKGGLFTKDQTALVNYRVQENKFIVDRLFKEAVLIAGVGRNQTKITIQNESLK